MKGFRFRLATVLRVRRLQEDMAKAALMTSHRDAHNAAARVDDSLAAYETAERPDGAQSFAAFERSRFRFEQAAGAVGAARVAHLAALAMVEERREEWNDAHVRVAVLERLEERRRDEHAETVRRGEERLIEDLVTSRHRIGGRP
jgi:flagellar FliJ protein